MQLPLPHFFTSERMIGLVDRPQMVPAEGPIADTVYGYHTLWIATVPFIPIYKTDDHKEFDIAASNRLTQVLKRQERFLYDLAQSREHLTTFELRFISWPQTYGYSRIGIAFLGKVFDEDQQTSRRLALELWNKFSAVFPHEAPFSYPLIPIQEQSNPQQEQSFTEWLEPLPFTHLTQPHTIVEMRKYEDWPTIRDVGGILHARDYIPHPFMPALDYSAMSRLCETLARQHSVCVVSITIRPQRLTDQEVVILHDLLGWQQRMLKEGAGVNNPIVNVLREFKSDIFDSYLRSRAKMGIKVYENLVREHRSLFSIRLQVLGVPAVQNELIESLRSEVMANLENEYPSRWTPVEPATPEELRWARFNAQWLEFARWGTSPEIRHVRALVRLRQLATVAEAAGAFRLPIAPSSGGLAGIEVRDEPFSLPIIAPEYGSTLTIGTFQDRGIQTSIPCHLSLDTLAGIACLFGSASQSRRTLLRSLLQQAHQAGIPWLLIRAADNETAAIIQELPAQRITLDAHHPPVNIQPFLPPPDVPITLFVDLLQRLLTTVYHLEIDEAILLRTILLAVYERLEGVSSNDRKISLPALVAALDETLQQTSAPTTTRNALRTHCLLPLQDLAITTKYCFSSENTIFPIDTSPTIIEVGQVGSDSSRALIYGSLWAWYALAFSLATKAQPSVHNLIALEDAHLVFPPPSTPNSNLPSPISTAAQTLLRQSTSTLLIDDRPDLLDESITSGNGIKILTHNTHEIAMEKAIANLNISQRERTRIRRLHTNEAIVAKAGIHPALINI